MEIIINPPLRHPFAKFYLADVTGFLNQDYNTDAIIKAGFVCPSIADLNLTGTTLKAQLVVNGYNQGSAAGALRLLEEEPVGTRTFVTGSEVTGFTTTRSRKETSSTFTVTAGSRYNIQGKSGIISISNGLVVFGAYLILYAE